MTTQTIEQTEIDPLTGEGRCAHIVKQSDGKTAAALVMESRVDGIELEALCGHRFIAQRDPKQYPPCQRCADEAESFVRAIHAAYRDAVDCDGCEEHPFAFDLPRLSAPARVGSETSIPVAGET